jgi:hypothetical protein
MVWRIFHLTLTLVGHTDPTTRSASAVRGRSSRVWRELAAAPRPIRSGPRSWRSTGHSVGDGRRLLTPGTIPAGSKGDSAFGFEEPLIFVSL